MSAESYWIERHALATGRAKQAEQDREAAIERAERVELLVRSVYMFGTGFMWKRPDGTEHVLDPAEVSVFIAADQQSEREQLTSRAERAEGAEVELLARVNSAEAAGFARAVAIVRAQADLPSLMHFDRPSDFRKGVLSCLAALQAQLPAVDTQTGGIDG